jgi:hypothetical protein
MSKKTKRSRVLMLKEDAGFIGKRSWGLKVRASQTLGLLGSSRFSSTHRLPWDTLPTNHSRFTQHGNVIYGRLLLVPIDAHWN